MARPCNDFSRTDLLRRGLAEAGAGLPAIEPGMPLPGRHRASPAELPRARRRPRARRLRRSVARAAAARGRDRRVRGRAGTARARLGLPRRRRRLAVDALPGRGSALPAPPPAARAAGVSGHALRRGSAPALASRRSRRSPTLHGEGKVTVLPGVGYTGPDQSHFTSRHFWEVGAHERAPAHRLARPLARPHRLAGQPAAGPVARVAPPAGARDGQGAGRVDRRSRPLRLLDARGLGRRREAAHAVARRARRGADARRPRARAGDRGLAAGGAPARAAAAVHAEERQARLHEPRRLPGRGRRLPAPARRPRGDARQPACPCAPSRSRHLGCTTPTTISRRRSRTASTLTAASLLAFQRDLEARGLADRVLVHVLVGVRTARAGERLERHRPRRGRHRLPRRHPGHRHDDRRVPGPREARPATATSARPRTSAASTRRCSRTGSARTRTAIIPSARSFKRPRILK